MPPSEFARRTGHRFNIVIKSLPSSESNAITMEALSSKLQKIGYSEGEEQLTTDIAALMGRGEVCTCVRDGKTLFWATEKGLLETRKRQLLIKLHNMVLTEEDLKVLESIAQRKRDNLE